MKFIHYGHSEFDENRFVPVKNCEKPFVKPRIGGLWGSPVTSPYGHRWFCESENFRLDSLKTHFNFFLKQDTKLLYLTNKNELKSAYEKGYLLKLDGLFWYNVDFEKISNDYDAILFIRNSETHFPLYGWDYDSVLVLNKEKIIPVSK